MKRIRPLVLILIAAAWYARAASAGGLGAEFEPRVPVSALGRPAAWFDPVRLHISTEVSVGSGFGGHADALQVTSLSYRFAGPLALSVSLGNQLGGNLSRTGRGLFLEGLDLGYRPFSSLSIQVHYRDFRSALQRQRRSADPFGLIP